MKHVWVDLTELFSQQHIWIHLMSPMFCSNAQFSSRRGYIRCGMHISTWGHLVNLVPWVWVDSDVAKKHHFLKRKKKVVSSACSSVPSCINYRKDSSHKPENTACWLTSLWGHLPLHSPPPVCIIAFLIKTYSITVKYECIYTDHPFQPIPDILFQEWELKTQSYLVCVYCATHRALAK